MQDYFHFWELYLKFLIKLMLKLSIKYTFQFYKNRFVSQIYGFLLVCVLPCCAFTVIEGWSYLDAVYFSLISLTTIGFGDFIPSVAPPAEYAINVRNDSACFQAMVDSTHTFKISNITGLPIKCNPVSQLYQIINKSFEILEFSDISDLRNKPLKKLREILKIFFRLSYCHYLEQRAERLRIANKNIVFSLRIFWLRFNSWSTYIVWKSILFVSIINVFISHYPLKLTVYTFWAFTVIISSNIFIENIGKPSESIIFLSLSQFCKDSIWIYLECLGTKYWIGLHDLQEKS